MKRLTCSALLIIVFTAVTAGAKPPEGEDAKRGVRVTLTIPVWIPGYTGQFAIGDIDVDGGGDGGDGSGGGEWFGQFFDASGKLEFFFLGRVRVDVNAWTFLADSFGGKLRETVTFRITDGTVIDASIRPAMLRVFAGRRIKRWTPGSPGDHFITLRGYGGVRYNDVDFEATLTQNGYPLEKRANWLDPIVGVQATFLVHEHWRFLAWTDIGGFGAGSRIAWWWEVSAGYRFADWFTLQLGWSMMHIDYRGSAGEQDLHWNAWLSGPSLALAFSF